MTLAIAILSISLIALLAILQNTVSASSQIERQSHIIRNLESRLSEIRSQYLQPGKQTTLKDLWGIIYEAEITQIKLLNKKDQHLPGLYRVIIRAKWKHGKIDMQEECEIIAYQP